MINSHAEGSFKIKTRLLLSNLTKFYRQTQVAEGDLQYTTVCHMSHNALSVNVSAEKTVWNLRTQKSDTITQPTLPKSIRSCEIQQVLKDQNGHNMTRSAPLEGSEDWCRGCR